MTTYKDIEHHSVLGIAQEYKNKGYEVAVEPDPQSLPDFLKEYRPDLIARNGEDNIVVEVKSFASLVRPNHLSELAQAIRENPAWRLELVVVNPKRNSQIGNSPIESAIREHLANVSQLRDEGYSHAALLTTLSALEAALRLSDMSSGVSRTERSALTIARSLFKPGFLTPEDHEIVMQGLRLHNSSLPAPADQMTENHLIDKLLLVIRALLERLPISESQPTLAAA